MSKALDKLKGLATALDAQKISKLDGRLVFEIAPISFGSQLDARRLAAEIKDKAGIAEEDAWRAENLALWLTCTRDVQYQAQEGDHASLAYFAEWFTLAKDGMAPADIWETHLPLPRRLTVIWDEAWTEGQKLTLDPVTRPGNGLTPEQKADPDLKGDGGNST